MLAFTFCTYQPCVICSTTPESDRRTEDEFPRPDLLAGEAVWAQLRGPRAQALPASGFSCLMASASLPVPPLTANSVTSCTPWTASRSVPSALYLSGRREWGWLACAWSLSP